MTQNMLYELRVLTGLHRGAALPLSGAEWSIGSSSAADLALYDPGIKGRHCQLRLVGEDWSLASHEGVLTDCEGHRVDAITPLHPGTPFALNGVWLSVVSANTEWPEEDEPADQMPLSLAAPANDDETPVDDPLPSPAAARRRPSLVGSLLLVAGLLILLLAAFWALQRQPTPAVAPPPTGKIHLANTAQVREVIERMLKERELHTRIRVVEENGKLMLHGNYDEDDLMQLTARMLLRFERRYQSPIEVDIALPKATAPLPFDVVQISNTRLAHVLTSDGRRIFLGDEVDGVRLVEINDHRVVFQGDRRIELSW